MSNIVQIEDFKGFHYLSINPNCTNQLQEYIDKYEDYYLCELMGEVLKSDFINDLVDGVPQAPEYLAIYNSFCENPVNYCCFYFKYFNDCDKVVSEGLKTALTGLIYYQFVTNTQYMHTLTGLVENNNENSMQLSPMNVERYAEKRWNNSVMSFNAIAYKIRKEELYLYPSELEYKFLDIV